MVSSVALHLNEITQLCFDSRRLKIFSELALWVIQFEQKLMFYKKQV